MATHRPLTRALLKQIAYPGRDWTKDPPRSFLEGLVRYHPDVYLPPDEGEDNGPRLNDSNSTTPSARSLVSPTLTPISPLASSESSDDDTQSPRRHDSPAPDGSTSPSASSYQRLPSLISGILALHVAGGLTVTEIAEIRNMDARDVDRIIRRVKVHFAAALKR